MKKIYEGSVSDALLTPAAVHRALSQLMDHKVQAPTYLAMIPDVRIVWFNTFLEVLSVSQSIGCLLSCLFRCG
jgi:hypothetical protein